MFWQQQRKLLDKSKAVGLRRLAGVTCALPFDAFLCSTGPEMSSDILTRVHVLSEKAEELAQKGHLLRAAENFGRAAEVARALGEDNLVTLHMELRRSNMLGAYARKAPQRMLMPPASLRLTALSVSRCAPALWRRWSADAWRARCWKASAQRWRRHGATVSCSDRTQTILS